jgi:hypothetical protein
MCESWFGLVRLGPHIEGLCAYNHSMSHKPSFPPALADKFAAKFAAKLVQEHATKGHMSHTPYIWNSLHYKKRPAVRPHVTGQKRMGMSGYPADATICRFLHTISVQQ